MAAKPVTRLTDLHVCPIHGTNAIITGAETVIINDLPMARVGDTTACGATIISGVTTVYGENMLAAHVGSITSHGGVITTGSPNVFVDDSIISLGGGAVINSVVNVPGAYSGMPDEGLESVPIIPIEATAEMVAEFIESIKEEGISLAIVGNVLIDTAMRKVGKVLPIEKITKGVEEFGERAIAKYRKIVKKKTHPDFPRRYHGHDDLLVDEKNRLEAVEVKATSNPNGKPYPKRNKSGKQGSHANNKQRGKVMKGKQSKVGKPSNRKGGPYTQKEIDLWKEIERRKGRKQHTFIRANKATNKAEVYEQDKYGNLGKKTHEFKVDD